MSWGLALAVVIDHVGGPWLILPCLQVRVSQVLLAELDLLVHQIVQRQI